jgi:hypothetical protein
MPAAALIRRLDQPRKRFLQRIRIAAWITLAGSASAGCGGDAGPTPAEIWCDGLCASVLRCGYQDPQCRPDCLIQRPGLARLSTNGTLAQQRCLENLSCLAISGDDAAWTTETAACWDQAKLAVAVTPHVRSFCAAHALAWFDCGDELSLDDCEHTFGMWGDAVLDALARCEAEPSCDDFAACETRTFSNP